MCHRSRSCTSDHPVGLVVTDDLHRSRLTVFFRLILAIPHIVWFVLWSIGVVLRRDRRLGRSRSSPAGCPAGCTASSAPTSATRRTSSRTSTSSPTRIRPFSGGRSTGTRSTSACPTRRRSGGALVLVRIAGRDPGARRLGCPDGRRRLVRVLEAGRTATGARPAGTSAAWPRSRRSSVGSRAWSRADAARPPRRRRVRRSGTARRRSPTCCSSPSATRTPTRTRMLAELEPPPLHPVRLEGDAQRSPPLAGHGVLPAPAADPASRLARALGGSPAFLALILQWFVTLFRGRPAAALPPLPLALRPLRVPRLRVRLPGREPVPGLHRRSRASTRSTSTCPGPAARTAGRRSSAIVLVVPGLRS